ncbi:MAG TPA: site-specific integrase [Firmicutes bacterium]|nr:site-specific integrase [Bacillota bacterium]
MRGHIEKRWSSSYTIIIDLGKDPSTGKRKRIAKNIATEDREVAEREMRRMMSELDDGTYVEPTALTLGDWCRQWYDMQKDRLGPKTRRRYAECIDLRLIPRLGHIRLDKLQPLHIQRFYVELSRAGRTGKANGADKADEDTQDARPLSPGLIRYHHAVLYKALEAAVKFRLIRQNPASGLELPKLPRWQARVKPLTPEQIASMLADARKTPYYIPILLAVTCGLRRGEILGLRWQDVDLEAGRLTINQTLGYTPEEGIYMKDAKTDGSHATVTIPPITVDALRAHRAERNKRRLKKGEGWKDFDLVCDRGDGAPCHPDSISSWFPKWMKGRGTDGITFHGLRHAHATWLISLGLAYIRRRYKSASGTGTSAPR